MRLEPPGNDPVSGQKLTDEPQVGLLPALLIPEANGFPNAFQAFLNLRDRDRLGVEVRVLAGPSRLGGRAGSSQPPLAAPPLTAVNSRLTSLVRWSVVGLNWRFSAP